LRASTASKKTGLPSYWERGRQTAAALLLGAAICVTFALRHNASADRLDQQWLIARFTARQRLHPPLTPDPNIVLVNFGDKSVAQWPEPILAWGPHFAKVIHLLHASGARVIALDWTHSLSAETWFKGSDTALGEALTDAGNVVMIKVRDYERHWVNPTAQIFYSLPVLPKLPDPNDNLGDADLGQSSVVDAFTPIEHDGQATRTFAERIVEHYYGAPGKIERGAFVIPGKLRVPLRRDGSALINYEGLPALAYAPKKSAHPAFRSYSLFDLAQRDARPDPAFRGKIVIIGATFAGSNDRNFVPFISGLTGGASSDGDEIQANIVRSMLSSGPILEPGSTLAWLLSVILSMVAVLAFYYLPLPKAAAATALAALAWALLSLLVFIDWNYALPVVLPFIGMAIVAAGMALYRGLREEWERHAVMGLWGRYQDPRVVDYLLQNPDARGGEGREADVTVLFADLKNFTKTVEHLPPPVALERLNFYLELMARIIIEHGGLVDKFLGDGLMAQWGVPEPRADHARAAVSACLEIERQADALTRSIQESHAQRATVVGAHGASNNVAAGHNVTFELRLTLHSGPVVLGFVGASRLEFTIIGDTVNVTSRLQETAKQLDCGFLISESVYGYVKERVRTGKEDEVEIRGRLQPLKVYEVTGEKE